MPTDEQKKVLEIAADIRKFEISLFWSRSVFFWGFTTTALGAYGAATHASNRNLQFAAACGGLVCSVIWTLVNRSSKYWQKVWEKKVEATQIDALNYDLFSAASNEKLGIKETWCWGAKHYSVSKLAIAFSDFTVGDLEKLNSRSSECSPDVNVDESKREQSGINRRQFRGVRRRAPIFRGAQ